MVKVMIAEDEMLMREKLTGIIDWEAYGFELAAVASNGREALDKYIKHVPEIVITDIKMPVMDGLEFSRRIISMGKPSKIILLTGFADFEYAREAVEIKATDYILKHRLTPELFLEKLRQLKGDIGEEAENRQIILEKELHDLLSGKPVTDKVTGGSIDVVLNRRNYVVCCMVDNLDVLKKNSDYLSFKTLSARFDEAFTHIAAEQAGSVCLHMANNEHILIIPADAMPKVEKTYLYSFCRKLQSQFLEETGTSVSVAFGDPCKSAEGLLSSYDEARKLLEHKFYLGNGQIIDNRYIPCKAGDASLDWPQILKEAGALLQDTDWDGTARYIDRLFQQDLPAARDKRGVKALVMLIEEKVVHQHIRRNAISARVGGRDLGDFIDDILLYDNILDIRNDLVSLLAYASSAPGEFVNANRKMKEAMKYAADHYDEKNLIQNIADMLGISPIYFGKVFKDQTGMRFVDFLSRVRLDKAKELLATGRYKIYEVAEKVGFSNIQYFSQKFKKATGENPYAFKERG